MLFVSIQFSKLNTVHCIAYTRCCVYCDSIAIQIYFTHVIRDWFRLSQSSILADQWFKRAINSLKQGVVYVRRWTTIGSWDGLLPVRRQSITWANAELLSIVPWRTNFSQIVSDIQTFHSAKLIWKYVLQYVGHSVADELIAFAHTSCLV